MSQFGSQARATSERMCGKLRHRGVATPSGPPYVWVRAHSACGAFSAVFSYATEAEERVTTWIMFFFTAARLRSC